VTCTGTGDIPLEEFATDPGIPGAVDYPAGSAYRRFYASTSGGTARLHLQVYIRTLAGTETLVRDEYSPTFTNTTAGLIEWIATAPSGGAMNATDRIVNKLSAQRVSGPTSITVTTYFQGTAHASHIQTTIAAGGVGPGVAAGGTIGQVLTKTSNADYATNWQTPATATPKLLTQEYGPMPGTVGARGMYRVPSIAGATVTFTLTRATLHLETAGSTTSTLVLEKSTASGLFVATPVATLTLAAGATDATVTTGLGIVASGNLIRFRWTALGTGAQSFHAQLEGAS
jgi:hypothetical protein